MIVLTVFFLSCTIPRGCFGIVFVFVVMNLYVFEVYCIAFVMISCTLAHTLLRYKRASLSCKEDSRGHDEG